MYRTCFCLISVLSVVCAASVGYLPRHKQPQPQSQSLSQSQSQAYYYNAPNSSTMAALRRIVLGHLQRFQEADRQRSLLMLPGSKVELQRQVHRQPIVAASQSSLDYAVPPNTPTPKNYAMNFLPEGRDVAPGTSYIPLRLLLIR